MTGLPWRLSPIVAVALLATASSPAPALARGGDGASLQVFAAASLTDAFRDLGRLFEQRHSGVRVRFNFGGSQVLARQIEQGASADVVATADERTMESLRGRIAGEPLPFARNRIVAIVPRGNPARIGGLADLARPGVKIVIAAESVPAGAYARRVIAKLAKAPGFSADFERRVHANVVSQEESVRGVVGKVQLGEADAGFVYRSDVGRAAMRHLRVFEVAPEWNVVAAYPIAVLSDARAPDLARAFLAFVRSDEGQALLRRHGFLSGDSAR